MPEGIKSAEASVPAAWNVGDVLLHLYEVTDILGKGGMGKVYKVHHKGWNVDLAVKSPLPQIFSIAGGKENFIREAETWVKLGLHPHIVSCYYVRELGGIPRVFAEYVEGGSLADWIRTRKLYEGGVAQALERILDIAIQFAWGLQYAHEQGLVHQDVKPANVMMTSEGTAKVTDFGLAKARGTAGKSGAVVGGARVVVSYGGMTPAYCSPEQARYEPLTPKTDMWSWAVSVLEIFTGAVTWRAGQAAPEALESYLEMGTDYAAIPRMPETFASLLKKCFELDAEARPESMREIGESLREIYEPLADKMYARPEPKTAELTADSLNNRALSFLDLGKSNDAAAAWQDALIADPLHSEATYNRGTVLWRKGELTDDVLVNQLRSALEGHPDRWDPKYLLAQVLIERGDAAPAVQLLEEVLAQTAHENAAALLGTIRSGGISSTRYFCSLEGHTKNVSCVCLNGNGLQALTSSEDGTLRLWELGTGRCLRTFVVGDVGGELPRPACFSSDGQWALYGHGTLMMILDLRSGECLRRIGKHSYEAKRIYSVCLSRDRHWAISGEGDTVRVWNVETGECARIFKGHDGGVASVSISPDGRWVLSGSSDYTLRLWEVAANRCVRVFKAERHWVQSVSVDAKWFTALSGGREGEMRLWELATGQCLRVFAGPMGQVQSVSLSGDGRFALSGDMNSGLRFWEVATGRCLRTLTGSETPVQPRPQIHRWQTAESDDGPIESVGLTPDGRCAVSASWFGAPKVWKIAWKPGYTCAPQLSYPLSYKDSLQTERKAQELFRKAENAFRSSRLPLAVGFLREARELPGFERAPETLRAWRTLTLKCPRTKLRAIWLASTLKGHTSYLTCTSFSADGRFALSGSVDQTARLWETATGRCVHTFKHAHSVNTVSISEHGHRVLSGGVDGNLSLWEVAKGRCVGTFQDSRSSCACLSPDGRLALSAADNDDSVRLWEVATGRCLRIFKGHTGDVAQICMSPDGRFALSRSHDNSHRLWELRTSRCLRIFDGIDAPDLVWPSGGTPFAISRQDYTESRVWKLTAAGCVLTFERRGKGEGHGHLTADARFVVWIGFDGRFELWDVGTSLCLGKFKVNSGTTSHATLSSDGRFVLLGRSGLDPTMDLWQLDWDVEACEAADWDEGLQNYLETFLCLHTPYAAVLPESREPTEEEITLALTRRGRPTWSEDDFKDLLYTLGCGGYGWLRPEGVRRELEKMAAGWTGPPPLPGVK